MLVICGNRLKMKMNAYLKFRFFVVFFCCFFCYPAQPHAEEIPFLSLDFFKLSLKHWYGRGSGRFKISWPLFDDIPKSEVSTCSTLDFKDTKNAMPMLSAELRVSPRLFFGYVFPYFFSELGERRINGSVQRSIHRLQPV